MSNKLFNMVPEEVSPESTPTTFSANDIIEAENLAFDIARESHEMENLLETAKVGEETLNDLMKNMEVLSSESVTQDALEDAIETYHESCIVVGLEPADLGDVQVDIAQEGIGEAIKKIISAIGKMIKKIIDQLKRLYIKVAIYFDKSGPKAEAMALDYKKWFYENKQPDTSGNWRLSDESRRQIYESMAAAFLMTRFDKGDGATETFAETYEKILDPNYWVFPLIGKNGSIKISHKQPIGDSNYFEEVGEFINPYLSQKIEDDGEKQYRMVAFGSGAIGILSFRFNKEKNTMEDASYMMHALTPIEAGKKVIVDKSYGVYEDTITYEFKFVFDMSPDQLFIIARAISEVAPMMKELYDGRVGAIKMSKKFVDDLAKSGDVDIEELKNLQNILLISNQITTDQLLSMVRYIKAGMVLLNKQSYNFKTS